MRETLRDAARVRSLGHRIVCANFLTAQLLIIATRNKPHVGELYARSVCAETPTSPACPHGSFASAAHGTYFRSSLPRVCFKHAGGQCTGEPQAPRSPHCRDFSARGGDLLRGFQRLVRFGLERIVARREVRRQKPPRRAGSEED